VRHICICHQSSLVHPTISTKLQALSGLFSHMPMISALTISKAHSAIMHGRGQYVQGAVTRDRAFDGPNMADAGNSCSRTTRRARRIRDQGTVQQMPQIWRRSLLTLQADMCPRRHSRHNDQHSEHHLLRQLLQPLRSDILRLHWPRRGRPGRLPCGGYLEPVLPSIVGEGVFAIGPSSVKSEAWGAFGVWVWVISWMFWDTYGEMVVGQQCGWVWVAYMILWISLFVRWMWVTRPE